MDVDSLIRYGCAVSSFCEKKRTLKKMTIDSSKQLNN